MLNMDKINKMLNPPKPKKKTEKQIFELPSKYTKGLSKKEKKEKTENVKETNKLLKEGKKKQAYEKAAERPTIKSNTKSSYTIRFKKKFPDTKPNSKDFQQKTGIPIEAQKEILKRGMGAFASSGSRSSVSSPQAWAIARLYSYYFNKGKTFDKDLKEKYNIKFK